MPDMRFSKRSAQDGGGLDKDGGSRDRKMPMCLMNILKVVVSRLLVSFLCSKPFDGSYCSECKPKFLQNLPLPSQLCPHWPRWSSNIQAMFSALLFPLLKIIFPRMFGYLHGSPPQRFPFLLKCVSTNPFKTMFFKIVSPYPSSPYNPFCVTVLLGTFHLLPCVISFCILFMVCLSILEWGKRP